MPGTVLRTGEKKTKTKTKPSYLYYFKLIVSRKQTHALDKKLSVQVGVILSTR